MKRQIMLCAALLLSQTSAHGAPPPPPSETELDMLTTFFGKLRQLPPENFSDLEPLVASNLKVYRNGQLASDEREAWFAYLRTLAGNGGQSEPRGYSVSREKYFRAVDGAITVLEFHFPLPPKGLEGQIFYHPAAPFQMVSYRFADGRLARLDYGPEMQAYALQPM